MAGRVCALLGLALVCASLGGCGESDSQSIPRDQLPAKVAEIFCQSLGGCCQSAGFAFDAAQCRSSIAATYATLLDDSNSSNVIYDGQAAGDCLASTGASLQCGRSPAGGSSRPASCATTFRGVLKSGQACQDSRECEAPVGSIVQCTTPPNAVDGPDVCVVERVGAHGAAGEACVGSCDADICGFGSPGGNAPTPTAVCYRRDSLYCSSSGTCEPLKAIGLACSGTDECERSSFCDDMTAVCTAPRAGNQPCNADEQCLSDNCDDDTLLCTVSGVTADSCAMPKLF